ncbi:MAG: hypothetical protein HKN44_07345 [Ilumatobacter sp.]|nr:hypothetical protein [Ilumatobacter sp.]
MPTAADIAPPTLAGGPSAATPTETVTPLSDTTTPEPVIADPAPTVPAFTGATVTDPDTSGSMDTEPVLTAAAPAETALTKPAGAEPTLTEPTLAAATAGVTEDATANGLPALPTVGPADATLPQNVAPVTPEQSSAPQTSSGRRRWLVRVLLCAVFSLGAFAAWTFLQSEDAQPAPSPAETEASDIVDDSALVAAAPDLVSVVAPPAGKTVEWMMSATDGWLAWAAAEPAATNPIFDATGEHCGRNQTDADAWYLAGSFGQTINRVCTVPADRILIVPVINAWCATGGTACGDVVPTATTSLELDGVALPTFTRDVPAVSFTGVEGNPITETGGPTQLTMSGEWAAIGPLDPGSYSVRIEASTGQFALDVGYLLIVE